MSAGFRHHGGCLAEACARYGGQAADWMDLSTGINPNGWRAPAGLTVDWQALPDPLALRALERTAAGYFGCDPTLCAAVPGSETGIRQIARVLNLPGLYQPLSYGTYRRAFAQAAMVADLTALPRSATVLVIGNPNNPDGRVLPKAALLGLLDHQEQHGGWLIVDEAFADCTPDWSISSEVTEARRLIVMRSFGKFFGLAGLRLGFAIAPQGVLGALREALGDWPVHAAALAHGVAAYADADWIAATRKRLVAQAAATDAVVGQHGLGVSGDCPLFRLVAVPDAAALFERLAQRRILTRPFDGHPDLLRIGLPADDAGLQRLDAALRDG